jgi:flavin-dependent dehydrogenase
LTVDDASLKGMAPATGVNTFVTMERVDILVIGAGPAGLRAAQVLAAAGREVLVLEKNPEVGPKTCGGGLSIHSARELAGMGLPPGPGRSFVAKVSFSGEEPVLMDSPDAVVRTVARAELGRFQLGLARRAGAEVRVNAPASGLHLQDHRLTVNGATIGYRCLIGADGSSSAVRRALGLRSPRALFAAEYNIAGLWREDLWVVADSAILASGYFWVFPHADYTSIGAVAPRAAFRPDRFRSYLDRRLGDLQVDAGSTPFEGAAMEVEYHGFDFAEDVHLVGDAAGLPSGLTAEGIYPALISGEETARRILEPGYRRRKSRAWLRGKRLHDGIAALGRRRGPRELLLRVFKAAASRSLSRSVVSRLLVAG